MLFFEVCAMACIQISGGCPLCGEVGLQGSKNAVLPMLAASLLIPGETKFFHCPDIADVRAMTVLLKKLGAAVRWEEGVLCVNAAKAHPVFLDKKDMADTRGCILFLGALTARFGQACLAHPGGCVIGKRPVDLHLLALEALGTIIEEGEVICGKAKVLSGAEIVFPFPSVGATQNAVLAAVLAEGITRLHNVAREPEVVHLCHFLNAAGAKIAGVGTTHLEIEGVRRLHPLDYTVPPDRIVAGTYMAAVLAAGGKAFLKGADAAELSAVIEPLRAAGAEFHIFTDGILVKRSARLRAFDYIKTEPYPGFPTDMQSQFVALAALSDGVSIIEETIFEARFGIVSELKKMGAKIYLDENKAVVEGVSSLSSETLIGRDLRGTAALLVAALAAKGESRVFGVEYLMRGYEGFVENLKDLGANVKFYA